MPYFSAASVVVSCPQVSSLYEALTWGLIHLRLFEPLAPSVLTMRVISKPRRGDGV